MPTGMQALCEIRYEPRSHPKQGWLCPRHQVICRLKAASGSGAKSRSIPFTWEGSAENEDLDYENLKKALLHTAGLAAKWAGAGQTS